MSTQRTHSINKTPFHLLTIMQRAHRKRKIFCLLFLPLKAYIYQCVKIAFLWSLCAISNQRKSLPINGRALNLCWLISLLGHVLVGIFIIRLMLMNWVHTRERTAVPAAAPAAWWIAMHVIGSQGQNVKNVKKNNLTKPLMRQGQHNHCAIEKRRLNMSQNCEVAEK